VKRPSINALSLLDSWSRLLTSPSLWHDHHSHIIIIRGLRNRICSAHIGKNRGQVRRIGIKAYGPHKADMRTMRGHGCNSRFNFKGWCARSPNGWCAPIKGLLEPRLGSNHVQLNRCSPHKLESHSRCALQRKCRPPLFCQKNGAPPHFRRRFARVLGNPKCSCRPNRPRF